MPIVQYNSWVPVHCIYCDQSFVNRIITEVLTSTYTCTEQYYKVDDCASFCTFVWLLENVNFINILNSDLQHSSLCWVNLTWPERAKITCTIISWGLILETVRAITFLELGPKRSHSQWQKVMQFPNFTLKNFSNYINAYFDLQKQFPK